GGAGSGDQSGSDMALKWASADVAEGGDYPGGGSERDGEDDEHRQAGARLQIPGEEVGISRGGYLQGGGDRAAEGVGTADGRRRGGTQAGRGPGRGRLRRAVCGGKPGRGRVNHRHRGKAAHKGAPDGRADEGEPRYPAQVPGGAPRGIASP